MRLMNTAITLSLFTACAGDSDLEEQVNAQAALIEQLQSDLDEMEARLVLAETDASAARAESTENAAGVTANAEDIVYLQSGQEDIAVDLGDVEDELLVLADELASVEDGLQAQIDSNASTLEDLSPMLTYISVDTTDDSVVFSGANVFIQSGSGSTDDGGSLSGLGNLVIGYDESGSSSQKDGSHNLVLGENNSYVGYGSMVSGYENYVASNSAVLASYYSYATGTGSNVVGGSDAYVGGDYSVVVGGSLVSASSDYSVAMGGDTVAAQGEGSVILGGQSNYVSGEYSVQIGGQNQALTSDDTVEIE